MLNEKKPDEKTLDEKTLEGVTGGYNPDVIEPNPNIPTGPDPAAQFAFLETFRTVNCNSCSRQDCLARTDTKEALNHFGEGICPLRESN